MVNILVAEDDKDDFLMLEEAIEKVLPEFTITHTRNGKELLEKIDERQAPDLIFLDLNMPKMNGIDCLISLRKKQELQLTPVVIYSTSSDFQDIDLCYKNGCSLYFVKPTSFNDLLAQIKKVFLHPQMEEALLKSEERFSLFLKASSEQVYKISPDWKEMYLFAGKEYLANTEKIGVSWLQKNVPEVDQAKVADAIQEAITKKTIFELEHRVTKADGTIGWAYSRVIPVINQAGEIVEWFGTSSDITRRKRAEEELKEEHYFLEQITDNTPVLIYVFDLNEQRFIYVNRRITELTGIEQDYVYAMGQHLFKKVLHPDDKEKRDHYFAKLYSLKRGETRDSEFRVRVGNSYRWFRSKDRVFKTEEGKVVQVIGLAEDVTYEKRLTETLLTETGGVGLN